MRTASILKKIISERQVTQTEIAKAVGIGNGSLSDVLSGKFVGKETTIRGIIDFLRLNEKTVLEEVSNSKKNKVKEEEDEKSSCILEKAISTVMHERTMSFGIAVETIRDSVVEIAPGYSMTNVIIKRKF